MIQMDILIGRKDTLKRMFFRGEKFETAKRYICKVSTGVV